VGVTHHRALWSPDFPPADGRPPAGDHPVRFSQSKPFITARGGNFLPGRQTGDSSVGSIQNIGVVPSHRGFGLGTCLIEQALVGFRGHGLRRVFLEVTAENSGAVRLYQRLGFRRTKTIYKVVEDASEAAGCAVVSSAAGQRLAEPACP
jgi:ribosomal protein S18 acetylase RimI-like enzyme